MEHRHQLHIPCDARQLRRADRNLRVYGVRLKSASRWPRARGRLVVQRLRHAVEPGTVLGLKRPELLEGCCPPRGSGRWPALPLHVHEPSYGHITARAADGSGAGARRSRAAQVNYKPLRYGSQRGFAATRPARHGRPKHRLTYPIGYGAAVGTLPGGIRGRTPGRGGAVLPIADSGANRSPIPAETDH